MIAARLAILAALWSPLVVSACCTPTVVRQPVVVRPPPCLDVAPPVPPTTEDDGLWSRYHAAMEAWAAYVVGACGEQPSINSAPADTPLIVGPYAD